MALQKSSDVSARLTALRQKFLIRAREDIQDLRAYADQIRRGELTADGLIRCYQRLHRLSGSAGTFGLPEFGAAARSLEKQLKRQAENFTNGSSARTQAVEVAGRNGVTVYSPR